MRVLYLIALTTLFSCSFLYGCSEKSDYEKHQSDIRAKERAWVGRGKQSIRQLLKDPDSAVFQNTFFHRGKDNIPIACGEVNSKNSLGGFSGFQRFISAGKPELTWLEEHVADFDVIWSRMCLS